MEIKPFVAGCKYIAGMRAASGGVLTPPLLREMDRLAADYRVGPRETMLHAVDRLRHIDLDEVDAAPGLAVAHWLVLGELLPADKELRKFWAIRAGQMSMTAKSMKVELAGAIELQRRAAAGEIVLRERGK